MSKKEKKRQAEQKRMLLQMKKEMESLEYEIKHSRLTNAKIGAVRNLKISARALQAAAPYVLTAGFVAGVFSIFNATPFYKDSKKAYLNTMTEFDNAGNIRYEQQYNELENNSELCYYSKWQKNSDGLYSRYIKTYSIKEKTYENIMELYGQKDLKLEDVLGEPTSNIKETKNNLTEEELQEDSFIRAVIYSKDKNDYIICKEAAEDNLMTTLLYILVTILAEVVPLYYRSEVSSFDFSDCIYEIKSQHQLLDIEAMTKKLEIKKDNYERMTR